MLKKVENKLRIICPIDYSSEYNSLSALQEHYISDFEVGPAIFTDCTLVDSSVRNPIALKDSYWSLEVKFEQNKVSMSQADGSYNFVELFGFTPVRDTSKETGDVLLYLYDSSARESYNYGMNTVDHHYVEIKNNNGENVINYVKHKMTYDSYEEEDVWTNTIEDSLNNLFPDFMPTVNSYNLVAIKALYE